MRKLLSDKEKTKTEGCVKDVPTTRYQIIPAGENERLIALFTRQLYRANYGLISSMLWYRSRNTHDV